MQPLALHVTMTHKKLPFGGRFLFVSTIYNTKQGAKCMGYVFVIMGMEVSLVIFNQGNLLENLLGNQCNLYAGRIADMCLCFTLFMEHVMSLFICYLHLI